MKPSPDVIDYEQLKRKEVFKSSVCVENEVDAWEEDRNEIIIDDLLDMSYLRRFFENFIFLNRIFSLQETPRN